MLTLYYPVTHMELYLFVVAVHICLAAYTWNFRNVPGAKAQISCIVCKGVGLLSLVWASGNNADLTGKGFAIGLLRIAMHLSSYFWFLQIVQLSRQEEKIPVAVRYILSTLAGLIGLAILTNPWHKLYWWEIWLDAQPVLGLPGPALVAANIVTFLFCILAMVFSLRWVFISVGLRRSQALLYTAAGIVSFTGIILDRIPEMRPMEPLPLCFLLSGVLITWGFYRLQIYSILPLAQEAAVQNMIDGLLVVDEQGYIADMNPAAQTTLVGLPATIGGRIETLTGAWPPLLEAFDQTTRQAVEAVREYPGEGTRYFELTVTLLEIGDYKLGQVVLIKDVTRQKLDQLKILETETALSILAERERLGRELHDGPVQTWHFLHLELQSLRLLLGGGQIEDGEKQVERLIGIVKEENTNARESIVGLKRSTAASQDFVANLKNYLAWYEKTNGIATCLALPEEPLTSLFSRTSEVQLLRIIQEALTNIRKHAQARHAKIVIKTIEGQVMVLIEDDGCGFDRATLPAGGENFGMQIMAERAAEAGGCLQIESQPGEGTKVKVYFCLEKQESGEENSENAAG